MIGRFRMSQSHPTVAHSGDLGPSRRIAIDASIVAEAPAPLEGGTAHLLVSWLKSEHQERRPSGLCLPQPEAYLILFRRGASIWSQVESRNSAESWTRAAADKRRLPSGIV